MARVLTGDVEHFDLTISADERRFDAAAVDARVREHFLAQGYDALHTDDDLGTSYTQFSIEGDRVRAALVPYSFYLKLAYMDLVREGVSSLASPRIANVGLLVVVMHEGRPCLVSQIKGRALDRGQLLAMTAAGKIDAHELRATNALGPRGDAMHRRTLDRELREELGIALDTLDPTPFHYPVAEPEVGNINHSCVARGADLDAIIEAFAAHNQRGLAEHGDPARLEVTALALLPIDRPHDNDRLDDIVTFRPTRDDVAIDRGHYEGTVYTWAVLDYFADAARRARLLARATPGSGER